MFRFMILVFPFIRVFQLCCVVYCLQSELLNDLLKYSGFWHLKIMLRTFVLFMSNYRLHLLLNN